MSRLHFEDILRLTKGTKLKLFVEKTAAVDVTKWWDSSFIDAMAAQSPPFQTQRMNAKQFYCFDITILNASHHRNILDGFVTSDNLQTELFNRREGFSFIIDGTPPVTMPIQWCQMIEFSRELLFFGPPLPRSRLYSDLFKGINALTTIRATFMWMAEEVAGDAMAGYALSNAYNSAENKVLLKHSQQSTFRPITNVESIPDGAEPIFDKIDRDCHAAFRRATTGWINQHESLISEDMYDSWVSNVETHYPKLWSTFASLRGINDTHKKGRELIPGKKRQVFHSILTNARQRNPQVLTWWSMIESVGLMMWSVGRTAFDCLTYWGSHVSARTRDRLLASLFDDEREEKMRQCLRLSSVIVFIIDNYQRGQHLKNQRGERSSTFVSGTNQIAEEAFLPDPNPEFDSLIARENLNYTLDEIFVSPDGMPSYELVDEADMPKFFADHKEMANSGPDFSGARVKKYTQFHQLASNLSRACR
jgi:hypothetical protein